MLKTFWITRTAIMTALLVVLQMATAPLGNPLITGSAVNMLLIISVMTCGLPTGLSVAALSPIAAKFIGIGPYWSLIPFIIAGNVTLVIIWHFICKLTFKLVIMPYLIALAAAAAGKFAVMYSGVARIAVPYLLQLPEQQAAAISSMFSVQQLFTALTGGALAALILPALTKALAGMRRR